MIETDRLPRDHEAERLAIGSIIEFPERADVVLKNLHERDLVDPAHQAILGAMVQQRQRGLERVDVPLLSADLRGHTAFFEGNAAAYLLELGQNATPAHIEHYVERIRKASEKRRLFSIGEAVVEGATNGKAPDEILTALRADIEDFERDASRNKPREKFTFADLRELYPCLNPPVVDGLFRNGETVNIISVSKVGKSWLAYNLALCIITGRKWLDRFETDPGRVLLIDNELHKPTLAHRIPVVANAMGIPREHYENDLDVWSLRGNLRSWQQLTADIMAIQPGEYQFIVCDAKYRFATPGKSENDNSQETETYNLLDQWGIHTESAIGLIHHSSKGSQTDKRTTDVGSGAGAQSRATDAHVVLREHEEPGVVVLDAAVRSFAPVEPLPLRWSFPLWVPDLGVDPGLLKGRLKPSEERQSEKDREGVDRIIKALRDGPATARQLRPKTGISKDRQQRLIDWMQSEGHLTVSQTTVRGNVCHEYKLVE